MRIERAPYTADIVRIRVGESAVWEWLVKKSGSAQVLTHGEETSKQAAVQNAIECIEKLVNSGPEFDTTTSSSDRLGCK